ncbi:hypothetical protein AVEN_171408-1 [Araneus ventricosus]|uniref:Uncharacterized protein n=1 Tax=Araneus ventricosus TaxID=182803 RepID=A0A4Y2D466_ARAVE|nr:hypothetical protein AVEN_171408-1 [Araneus ventricosus]
MKLLVLEGDEECVPKESNNSDDESVISSQHDSECHESNNSDNECSETNPETSINSKQKRQRGSTRGVCSGNSRKCRNKCSIPNIPPSVRKEEILKDGIVWKVISPSGTVG